MRAAFHDDTATGRTIGLWPEGADPTSDAALVSASLDDATEDGTARLATDGMASGDYQLAMIDGDDVIAASSVTVLRPRANAWVRTGEHRYVQGEPIDVEWFGAPGNRYDWLALNRNCFDPESCPLRGWRYVNAASIGSASFTPRFRGCVAAATRPLRGGALPRRRLRLHRHQRDLPHRRSLNPVRATLVPADVEDPVFRSS